MAGAHHRNRGFSLVEILIYIALLVVMVAAIVNVFFSETNAWGSARAERNATDGGKLIMERITHEIRLAQSVNIGASIFGAHPGKLGLNTFEGATSTQPTTLSIFLSGTELKLQRGATSPVTLSGSSTQVLNLIFHYLDSPKSQMVRVELTAQASQGKIQQQKNYTTAVILRDSY